MGGMDVPCFAALLGLSAGLLQARLWPRILFSRGLARQGFIALKLLGWLLPLAALAWRWPLAAALYALAAGLSMTGFVWLQRRE